MAEKSENEASKTGQDVETPETGQDVKRDRQGEPYGDSGTADQSVSGGYTERDDHVPDPTALTGTLETSGTGGGVNERLTGTTRVFGDVEEITRRVENLIGERITLLQEEVRGLLLQREATAQVQQIPQQTVEDNGLPTHTGNIIAGQDDTGAAKDASRSANVAGSPDDVSDGITRVEDPAQDSYSQTTIAGARNPSEPVEKAKQAEAETSSEEPKESGDGKDFQQAADDYAAKIKEVASGKTTARKTTARRQTGGTTKK